MISLNQKIFLYFTLAAAPLYIFKFSIFSLPTNALDLLLFLNIFIWIVNIFFQKRSATYSFPPKKIMLFIGLILIGAVISTFANDAKLIGLGILKSWFLLPLLFSYIVFDSIKKENDIEKFLKTIYYSVSIVAFIAIIYRTFNVVTYDNRLSAFYSSPNYLAMYLSPGLLLGFYFLLKTKSEPIKNKLLICLLLLLNLLALFFTYSYASWLAVFLSLLITSLIYFRNKNLKLTFIGTLLIFFVFAISQLNTQKFANLSFNNDRSSISSRIMIWNASKRLMFENPILGIGPGNFQNKYLSVQKYFPPYLEWAVPQPHNIMLAFWLQCGIIGLIGFISLIAYVLYSLTKNRTISSHNIFLFSYFIYIFLNGLADTPFWKNDLSLYFWVFLAIFSALKVSQSEQKSI